MPRRLSQEEVVTIKVLASKGQNRCAIGRTLGMSEGTVRYHLKRQAAGATDRRSDRGSKADPWAVVIASRFEENRDALRPVNLQELFEQLCTEHGFLGSYACLVRYVRKHFSRPSIRPYRRVETPAGAQTQTDWGEYPRVLIAGEPRALHAFVMVLSHSRMPALVWSTSEDQLSWLRCHNEAYRRLCGIAAVNRIDNVKTALSRGAGAWGVINDSYRSYSRALGFHIDACAPRAPEAKGKVEAKVRLSRRLLNVRQREYDDLEELQFETDQRIVQWAKTALCPSTGKTVQASWELEVERLRPLPLLPEPFDVVVTRTVQRDCLVQFEARSYAVPFVYVGRAVEVRECAGKVQIVADDRVVKEYARGTAARLLIDPSCYEGEGTDRVAAPVPLGRMGRKLQELALLPVERRPLDLYAALAEVAR